MSSAARCVALSLTLCLSTITVPTYLQAGGTVAALEFGSASGHSGETVDVPVSWRNPCAYDSIRVERNGSLVAELPGSSTEFLNAGIPQGVYVYKITGLNGERTSFPASAFLSTVASPGVFKRGDANRDDRVDVSDAVAILTYLFLHGGALPCEDAADADDSGSITITDPILTLQVLFLGGRPFVAPGNRYAWFDLTPDNLTFGK